MTKRPNILLIMTDQQRADSLGYARSGASDTPNLDGLARRGVIFDNAYSSGTTCVPARASLLTGLLHHRVPLAADKLTLREGYWTVAHAFARAGYETALFGKMHLQPMRANHGFQVSRLCEHLTAAAGYDPEDVDDYRAWLVSTGRKDNRFHRAGRPVTFAYDAEYHPTSWITRQAVEFIEGRDPSRPYFAVVSYANPHTPYDPPEPYASMYPPAEQALPDSGLEANARLPLPFHLAVFDTTPKVFGPTHVDQLPEERVRHVLGAIRALVKQIDDAVGRLMAYVDLSNTILFFTSDHGDYGGHRGLMGKIPWIPFDDLARVPFFVVAPGIAGGRRVPQLVQSFDFVLTALEFAGVEPPAVDFDSQSLVQILRGEPPDDARPVFCSTTQGWPMVRRGRYKDIWHSYSGDHILYDIAADPGERKNIASDATFASMLADNVALLKSELAKPVPDVWCRGSDD